MSEEEWHKALETTNIYVRIYTTGADIKQSHEVLPLHHGFASKCFLKITFYRSKVLSELHNCIGNNVHYIMEF